MGFADEVLKVFKLMTDIDPKFRDSYPLTDQFLYAQLFLSRRYNISIDSCSELFHSFLAVEDYNEDVNGEMLAHSMAETYARGPWRHEWGQLYAKKHVSSPPSSSDIPLSSSIPRSPFEYKWAFSGGVGEDDVPPAIHFNGNKKTLFEQLARERKEKGEAGDMNRNGQEPQRAEHKKSSPPSRRPSSSCQSFIKHFEVSVLGRSENTRSVGSSFQGEGDLSKANSASSSSPRLSMMCGGSFELQRCKEVGSFEACQLNMSDLEDKEAARVGFWSQLSPVRFLTALPTMKAHADYARGTFAAVRAVGGTERWLGAWRR